MTKKGLIPTQEPVEGKETSASVSTKKLMNLILSRKLRSKPIKYREWLSEFVKLEKKETPEAVMKVMDWYVKNIGKEFVPEAYCASSFRKKFDQIKKQADEVHVDVRELSERQQKLLRRLSRFNWAGCDKGLAKVVQTSFERYEVFRKTMADGIKVLRERAEQEPSRRGKLKRLANIIDYLFRSGKISSPEVFLMNWMDQFATIISKGYEVSGTRLTFATNNPTFLKYIHHAVYDYCHTSMVWDEIVKELKL